MSEFSEKLKCLRIAHGITQTELACTLNVSRSCIANYERDRRQPDRELLLAIAQYFRVSIDYLIGRDNIENCKLQEIVADSERICHQKTLDTCTMDTESKLMLLQFYRFLSGETQSTFAERGSVNSLLQSWKPAENQRKK